MVRSVEASQTAMILAALANPQAAMIFRALPEDDELQGLTTHQLAQSLQLPPSSVSRHLSSLREAGLATSARAARLVLYRRQTGTFDTFINELSSWSNTAA